MASRAVGIRIALAVVVAGLAAFALAAKRRDAVEGRISSLARRVVGPPTRERPPAEVPHTLGTNFEAVSDWNRDSPFVDLFKTSRAWTSGSEAAWDDGRTIALTRDGYPRSLAPGQIARTLLLTGVPALGGRYVVLYDGEGEIRYGGSARFLEGASRPGRHVLELREGATDGILINVTRTDRARPIRNLRVLPPGGVCAHDATLFCDPMHPCGNESTCLPLETAYVDHVFHPIFLDRIERYRVLRFMTWNLTNGSVERHWSDRAQVADASYAVRGAPYETALALARTIDADPWITVPHLVDDDYVRRLAALVKENLPAGRRVWIEHSNEVWNGQFAQSRYATERGRALAPGQDVVGTLRYHAKRSTEIFAIFERVFGGPDRLVRVLGAQAANPWGTEQILTYRDTAVHADALAIAPYLGMNVGTADRDRIARMSVDDVFRAIDRDVFPDTLREIAEQKALADRYGLRLVAYEGGQHLVGIEGVEHDREINSLFDAVNRDARMRDVYTRYLDGWFRHGGETFVHFLNASAYSDYGRWGSMEHIRQSRGDAPKYDALMQWFERSTAGANAAAHP